MKNVKSTITSIIIILLAILPGLLQAEARSKFHAAIHVDYFSPQQQAYKDLYGSGNFPINIRLGYMFKKRIMIFTGIRYLNSTGETATTSPRYFDESYTTRLTIISIPVGINWYLGSDKFNPFFGCGGYYHSYKESWDSLDSEYKGNKFAFFAQGGILFSMGARFSVLLQASYTTLPTGIDTPMVNGINLGGMAAGAGFAFRF